MVARCDRSQDDKSVLFALLLHVALVGALHQEPRLASPPVSVRSGGSEKPRSVGGSGWYKIGGSQTTLVPEVIRSIGLDSAKITCPKIKS